MNIVGIVAEYNPMHNGHVYNIKKSRELTNADYAIVIMSGSFTEQGNMCAINKFDRAKIAIENGADLVLELPTVYATSSSENFATGAIKILNSLGVVTHLAFGCEEKDITVLENVAQVYLENKNEITEKIKEKMKNGISSSSAYDIILSEYFEGNIQEISKPNNILAIEYLKSLYSLQSQIKPILINRLESNHNDDKISSESIFTSSTSIRNVLKDNTLSMEEKLKQIRGFVPENTFEYLKNNKYNTNEDMWNLLRFEITRLGKDGLKNIYGVGEGIENRLYSACSISNSYEEYILNVKTKRYTLSRIKRICVNILLGITKEKYNLLSQASYARVLKVKDNNLLSLISKNSSIPVITKITDKSLIDLDKNIKDSIKLDVLSNNIANPNMINFDYLNKIKQP